MHDYMDKNKAAMLIFNNFTSRLSSMVPDISSLMMELQTPKQHLMVSCMSHPIYSYHMVKFAAFVLGHEVVNFPPRNKKNTYNDLHATFLNELFNGILMAILD
jgi:hypothetical protein